MAEIAELERQNDSEVMEMADDLVDEIEGVSSSDRRRDEIASRMWEEYKVQYHITI